jgi:hypothetical protein
MVHSSVSLMHGDVRKFSHSTELVGFRMAVHKRLVPRSNCTKCELMGSVTSPSEDWSMLEGSECGSRTH